MRSILDLPRLGEDPDSPFPPTSEALESPNGLLAWGGDLHPSRLMNAYRCGVFPWYTEGQPILWWSPAPRCVIVPERIHLSERTGRRYNSGQYRLTADEAFPEVVEGCAEPRGGRAGTWITLDMADAYTELHELGYAHSLEVWRERRLVGGIYGLMIGTMFFGESMFSRSTDASKIALVALCRQLRAWGCGLLDCQIGNPHLYTMGAEEISRQAFEAGLTKSIAQPGPVGSWRGRIEFEERW